MIIKNIMEIVKYHINLHEDFKRSSLLLKDLLIVMDKYFITDIKAKNDNALENI